MKLLGATTGLIIAFSSISVLNDIKFRMIEQFSATTTHNYDVLRETAALMASMVDQETGLRGDLVSGEPDLPAPYHAGAATHSTRWSGRGN